MHAHLRRRLGAVSILIAVGLGIFGAAAPALAVDNGTVGIKPANESDFFHISLAPGAAIENVAIVSNYTDAPVTLLTYPVDAENSAQGTFAFGPETADLSGVGSWVTLEAGQVIVPAQSNVKVAFRLSVPQATPPGDYAGGLIIQSPPVEGTTSTIGTTAVRLDVIQRQGVRIYVNVAGKTVKALTHGALAWEQAGDAVTFTLPVHNTGNTILHPTAVLDLAGWPTAKAHLDFEAPESLLPGASLTLHARLVQAPLVHVGNADATIRSEAGNAYTGTTLIYAPWVPFGIGVLALLVVFFGAWRAARFVRRARRALAQLDRTASNFEHTGSSEATRSRHRRSKSPA
ncbi:WxL protein peptidoglycan domain-containing protein [Cryobacterium luteum]|uniref:DUF916 domain-containing protein n=1 Tax=Cryobacterium luteum TaxID=1424661 RepID=A0A1H8KGT0_9MICO|nr:DUF916 domain-containing protein [Cryobacterium luteum]TFB89977.1 DUF916 domain-containing protein [Cryobacterium luteum]SEN92102.1 protein of unknown function [Cryobacterium luteum]